MDYYGIYSYLQFFLAITSLSVHAELIDLLFEFFDSLAVSIMRSKLPLSTHYFPRLPTSLEVRALDVNSGWRSEIRYAPLTRLPCYELTREDSERVR